MAMKGMASLGPVSAFSFTYQGWGQIQRHSARSYTCVLHVSLIALFVSLHNLMNTCLQCYILQQSLKDRGASMPMIENVGT